MLRNRTIEWWLTRFLFATGIAQIVLLVLAMGRLVEPCLGCDRTEVPPFGLPLETVLAGLGAGMAIVGLVWMIRILRGPGDAAPAWRYRDH